MSIKYTSKTYNIRNKSNTGTYQSSLTRLFVEKMMEVQLYIQKLMMYLTK